MPFIELRKATESGKEVRPIIVNSDLIILFERVCDVTAIRLEDGSTVWAMETVDEIKLAMISACCRF
jgi:hypothetical protein